MESTIEYKLEFQKLFNLLNNNVAIIELLKFVPLPQKASGLLYFLNKPIPKIIISLPQDSPYYYKEAIFILIHEYGHIIDFKKNEKCKRLQLHNKLSNYDYKNIFYCTKKEKIAFLLTEFLAYEYGRILLKNICSLDYDDLSIDQTLDYKVLYNYFFYRTQYKFENLMLFKESIKKSGVRVTRDIIKHLKELS